MSKPIYLFSTSSHPDTIHINSLDVTLFKPDIDFTKYDYFIITSKQVSRVLKQYDKKLLKPALCISKVTAESYQHLGGEVLALGTGYGDNLSLKIKEYSKTTKWLYLRAKVVASDFVTPLQEDGFDITEILVYESRCSQEIQDVKVEDGATLIFTSPSSVTCFFKNNSIDKKANVIVIGETTAKALPSNIRYEVSKETTIQSCLDLIK